MPDTKFRERWLAVASAAAMLAACSGGDRGDSGTRSQSGSAAPAAATPAPRPAGADASVAATPSRPVDSETLPYAEVEDQLAYGYFAFPSDMVEPLPAIVLIHDWWGLNEEARAAANRLAAEGYMVLAVDLYRGEVVSDAPAARDRTIAVLEDPAAVEDNLRQAIEFVEDVAGAPAVGAVGWGFGGSWALESAMLFPDSIAAVVVVYGQVSSDESRLADLEAPVLAIFGGADRSISQDTIDSFGAAMERLGNALEIEIYPDAGHAFADPARSKYDPGVAEAAWRRMLGFFAEALPSEGREEDSQ